MNSDNIVFRNAQRNFYNWTTKWFHSDEKETTMSPDIIEIVTLLQALGFKVRFFDFNNPEDVPPLQSGKKGLKINVLCSGSGLRCSLELDTDCKCPRNSTEVTRWEVSGTVPNSNKDEIMEIGSDVLLPAMPGVQAVMGSVINHFFHLVNTPTNDHNENDVRTPRSATKPNPLVNVTSPEIMPMSPHRYRSLDTLTDNAVQETVEVLDEALPTAGGLRKDPQPKEAPPALICSSPNLSETSQPSGLSSPVFVSNSAARKLICSKLKNVQDLVTDVLELVDADRAPLPMLTMNISNIKGSTESLPAVEASKIWTLERQARQIVESSPSLTTYQLKPGKPTGRPSIRSASTTSNNSVKTTTAPAVAKYKMATSVANKVLESIGPPSGRVSLGTRGDSTKKPPGFTGSKTSKYSHIKSTIPKVNMKKS